MSRFLKVIASTIALASILSLNGCSSGSNNNGHTPPTGHVSGGVALAAGKATGTTAITGTGNNVQASVTDAAGNTTTQDVFVPAGFTATVTPATPLLVIPAGTKPLELANSTTFKVAVGNTLAASQAALAAGTSGITVNADGSIAVNIAIPLNEPAAAAGSRAATPVVLLLPQGNVKTRDLTFQNFVVNGATYVVRNADGSTSIISPFPSNITGTIPQNGENTDGANIVATYGTGNTGRQTSLDLVYDSSHSSSTGAPIVSAAALTATYKGFGTNTIPANGVTSITINVGPLPGN